MEVGRFTRDGTAEPVSRNQIRRRERGQGKFYFPCSANKLQVDKRKAINKRFVFDNSV